MTSARVLEYAEIRTVLQSIVMKIRTLKLMIILGSIFVWLSVIVMDVCLFSQLKCISNLKRLEASIIFSLKRLSFQEASVTDSEENVLDLPRGLNHHVWINTCMETIEKLCNFPVFPMAPDERKVTFRTEFACATEHSGFDGHRLFGFVIPNATSEYHFAVASNGFAEVWLSLNSRWRVARKIAHITPFDAYSAATTWQFNVSITQMSAAIHLKARRRYYIEILHTNSAERNLDNFVRVAWKRSQESDFETIDGRSLSLYTEDEEKGIYKIFDDELPGAVACETKNEKGHANKYMRAETLHYLQHSEVKGILDYCEYKPSYAIDRANVLDFRRFDGVQEHVRRMYSFPFPIVDGIIREKIPKVSFYAEYALEVNEAWMIVYKYMDALRQRSSG